MTNPLSIHEHNILVLLREGHTLKEIASMVHLAVPTVYFHSRILCAKLGAKTICHAVVLAIRRGWIKLEEPE